MKNYWIRLISGLCILAVIFIVGCKKDDLKQENQQEVNVTATIQKIETTYTEGCNKVEAYNPNYVKIETQASEETKHEIQQKLEQSYSKTVVLKNGGNRVGVFKSGSCAGYQTLEVYMDCEDDNGQSSSSGWKGDCYVANNVTLEFCIVDGAYFDVTGADYAILNLSSSTNWGSAHGIRRYFDNEDNGNANHTLINGQSFSGYYGFNSFGNNTCLQFYYYKKYGTALNFPNLGISYGTLGRYGSNQGWIFSDDEDNGNANWAYYYETSLSNPVSTGNIPNIMDVGSNTRLYISKAW